MAFIKRSTILPTKVKVGTKMFKCSSCGVPNVSRFKDCLCPKCTPRTMSFNEDGTIAESVPDFEGE